MTMQAREPMRNRYAGSCNVCGDTVGKGSGVLFKAGGKWQVAHDSCDANEQAGEAELRKDNPRDRLTYKQIHGRCEDAPCCGCCGQFDDGYSSRWHDDGTDSYYGSY